MRHALALLSAGLVAALAGCTAEPASVAISRDVAMGKLDAGRYFARFEASVIANGEDSGLDYGTALLMAGGQACGSRTLSVQDRSTALDTTNVPPPAGKKLTMTVACHHDRMPGHRVATQDEAWKMYETSKPGSTSKMGSRLIRRNETRLNTAETLIGGFVREAYTEDCAGQALVVDGIELASVPDEPGSESDYVESLHGVLHFHCVDSSQGSASPAASSVR